MSPSDVTRNSSQVARGPARWTLARIRPAVFYAVFVGPALLGLGLLIQRHLPWVAQEPDSYGRAWLMAGLAALFFSGVILWLDRYEREPWRLLLVAFLWGALVAPGVLRPLDDLASDLRHDRVQREVSAFVRDFREEHDVEVPGEFVSGIVNASLRAVSVSQIGPFLEEVSKALAVFLIFLLMPHEFDGVLDGLIYGALVGLGFAMVENVQYLYRAQASASDAAAALEAFWSTARSRIFFHGLTGHAMYTGLAGAGLGLARSVRQEWLRWSGPPLGFLFAVLAHMTWNSVVNVEGWWQGMPIAESRLAESLLYNLTRLVQVSGPFLVLFLLLLILSWRRERNALLGYLPAEGITAYTRPEVMLRGGQRRRALLRALRERGLRGWYVAVRLQRALIEWAFVRWHQATGVLANGVDPAEVEGKYRARVSALVELLDK